MWSESIYNWSSIFDTRSVTSPLRGEVSGLRYYLLSNARYTSSLLLTGKLMFWGLSIGYFKFKRKIHSSIQQNNSQLCAG